MNGHRARNIGLGLLALLVVVYAAVPWKSVVSAGLRHELGKRGVVVESFEIEGISPYGLAFSHLRVQQPVVLAVEHLALGLSPRALLRGDWGRALSHITLNGAPLRLESEDGKDWRLNGILLPGGPQPQDSGISALGRVMLGLATIPDIDASNVELSLRAPQGTMTMKLAFSNRHTLTESRAELHSEAITGAWSGQSLRAQNLDFTLVQTDAGLATLAVDVVQPAWGQGALQATAQFFRLRLASSSGAQPLPAEGTAALEGLQLTQGALQASIPHAEAALRLDITNQLAAKITLPTIALQGVPPAFATLSASAACVMAEQEATCEALRAETPDRQFQARGNLTLPYADPHQARWSAQADAAKLWGGTLHVTAKPVSTGFRSIAAELSAQKLQVQEVLSLLAAGKVKAEGTMSGHIPLVWRGGTNIQVGSGQLRSDAPGRLEISPELLGMSNPTVGMVSSVLQDFRYEHLSVALEGTSKGGLKAQLSLLGHNPAQWNGRSVNLHVNLGGDLLSLLQQSLLPMSDPRPWLPNPSSSPR